MRLSKAITTALLALNSGDVVNAMRLDRGDYFYASVGPRDGNARFTVNIASFRKMAREGWVARDAERSIGAGAGYWAVFVLTDAGRAALEAP